MPNFMVLRQTSRLCGPKKTLNVYLCNFNTVVRAGNNWAYYHCVYCSTVALTNSAKHVHCTYQFHVDKHDCTRNVWFSACVKVTIILQNVLNLGSSCEMFMIPLLLMYYRKKRAQTTSSEWETVGWSMLICMKSVQTGMHCQHSSTDRWQCTTYWQGVCRSKTIDTNNINWQIGNVSAIPTTECQLGLVCQRH